MNINSQFKVLKYIEESCKLINAAEKRAAELEALEAKVNDLIPSAVDALIKNKRIDEGYRKQAAEVLKDHKKALEVLIKVANHRTDSEANYLGKQASVEANKKDSSFVDRVRTDERESDRVFRETIMNAIGRR